MQTNRFKLPAYQVWLNHACLLACLGTAFLLYSWPALFAEYRLPLHAHQVLSALLWINALVLLLSMAATRLKFTTSYVRQVLIGVSSVSALAFAAVNVALVWQIYTNNLWVFAGVFGLILPATALGLMGLQLLTEDKSEAQDEDVQLSETEPEATGHNPDDTKQNWADSVISFAKGLVPITFMIMAFCILSALICSLAATTYYISKDAILTHDSTFTAFRFIKQITNASINVANDFIKIGFYYGALFILITLISIPLVYLLTYIFSKLYFENPSKEFSLSDQQVKWHDDQITNYEAWVYESPKMGISHISSVGCIFLALIFSIIPAAPVFYLSETPLILFSNSEPILFDNDNWIAIAFCFPFFFILMPLFMTAQGITPGFRALYLAQIRSHLEAYPATFRYSMSPSLIKALEDGRVSSDADLAPEDLHKMSIHRSIRQISRLFKWAIPAFVLACVVDIFWYRVWYEDHVTVSPVWTWQTYDFAYADALSAEALCRVVKDDGDLEVRATFTLTFPDDTRLGFNNAQVLNRLPVVLAVQDALIAAEVPISQRLEEEHAPCQTTLIEDWGEEKGAATWSALFEPRP